MADELTREVLGPERLEEMRAEELEKLRAEIDDLVVDISRREWRDMVRSLDSPYQAPTVDAALPLMRVRLAMRRTRLVEILNTADAPRGVEDEGLAKEKPTDRALLAVKDVLKVLIRAGALPVEDPLISDDEVEEEYERQTGDPGAGSVRRRTVHGRGG